MWYARGAGERDVVDFVDLFLHLARWEVMAQKGGAEAIQHRSPDGARDVRGYVGESSGSRLRAWSAGAAARDL